MRTLIALAAALSVSMPLLSEPAVTSDDFINQAVASGQSEVQLAEIALRRAQSPALRGLASLIVKNRAATNESLARVAARSLDQRSAATPDLQEWKEVPESSFDAAYLRHLIASHEEAVALFRTAASGSDERLAKFARNCLPILESHLQHARDLQGELTRDQISLAAN